MIIEDVHNIISLGRNCGVRYQIAQFKYRQAGLDFDPIHFDPLLYDTKDRSIVGKTYYFDNLVSHIITTTKLLGGKFSQSFLKENLRPEADGSIMDTGAGTMYYHEFSTNEEGVVTQEAIDNEYVVVNEKVSYLAKRFMAMLNDTKKICYITSEVVDLEDIDNFVQMMKETYPHHPFHIIGTYMVEGESRFIQEHEHYSIYEMHNTVNKPDNKVWQGDNDEWQKMLGHIKMAN